MNKNIICFVLFVFLLLSIGSALAQQDPIPLTRFWGLIENSEENSPNCNLISNIEILRNSEDLTYTKALGFHEDKCYYSIDVETSKLSSGDTLLLYIDEVSTKNSFVYESGTIINENIIVELPDEYYSFIEGCMDKKALNYDTNANINIGCEYPIQNEDVDKQEEQENADEPNEDETNEEQTEQTEIENEAITTNTDAPSSYQRREPNTKPPSPQEIEKRPSDISKNTNYVGDKSKGTIDVEEKTLESIDMEEKTSIQSKSSNDKHSDIFKNLTKHQPIIILVTINVLAVITVFVVIAGNKFKKY